MEVPPCFEAQETALAQRKRLVACEIAAIVACLAAYGDFLARKKMIRAFAFLFAALTVLAGVGHAQAQERTFYDIFGGGPNFGGGGYGGSGPIQRSAVSL